MIEGHTDKQGPEKDNQKLSEKRAESLKKFLISKGIDASRYQRLVWVRIPLHTHMNMVKEKRIK